MWGNNETYTYNTEERSMGFLAGLEEVRHGPLKESHSEEKQTLNLGSWKGSLNGLLLVQQ